MSEFYPQQHRNIDKFEATTQARFSLAYSKIGSTDTIINHVSGSIRVVSYDKDTRRETKIRNKLTDKGLIVGSLLVDIEPNRNHYKIPKSARPIEYESYVHSSGEYSYNDKKLFYELGELLGDTQKIIGEKNIIEGDLGRMVSFVEFSEPGTRQLFLVPGVEKTVTKINKDLTPLDYYSDQLNQIYDNRFEDAAYYFGLGFIQNRISGDT